MSSRFTSPVSLSNDSGLNTLDRVVASEENHKPSFVNCSKYNPQFAEEQGRNKFVMNVRAYDIDPIDKGGRVTYELVNAFTEIIFFRIDNITGDIYTVHNIDRDWPSRKEVFYIIVQATDNGVPPLSDVCTIKLTITDINDNEPWFDKQSYKELMPQDLAIGNEVMRMSATDFDNGNNSLLSFKITAQNPEEEHTFRMDEYTGVIYLNTPVEKQPGYTYLLKAIVTDHGQVPLWAEMDVSITVVGSNKKSPSFIEKPSGPIQIAENYRDFKEPIAVLRAQSNMQNQSDLIFHIVAGRIEQSNRQNTFILESIGDTAYVKLGKSLDYETVTDYTLTIRVQNKNNLAIETKILIDVLDVNDNTPAFPELISGSVPENEPIGTAVMQVRAIDLDGTSANNQVTYRLDDHKDLFTIDPQNGNITTLVKFDREEQSVYSVKVIATDNSPSIFFDTGEHNEGQQVFRIEISDKNDNKPSFTKNVYVSNPIPENANIHTVVIEVLALDNDTASPVVYSIINGNEGDAFKIENNTGKIRTDKELDYEQITNYTLTVRAFDGAWADECRVEIQIANVNDNPPELLNFKNYTRIQEEMVVQDCIAQFNAFDPDIKDINAPQHILFIIWDQKQSEYFTIDKSGCLRVIRPLDRDPPNSPERQLIIVLADDDGGPTALKTSVVFNVYLDDINDNAPYLDIYSVVWYENEPSDKVITVLTAKDIDSDKNGAPFTYALDENADPEIKQKFYIIDDKLFANVVFDREEKKFYLIPIKVSDSGTPMMTGVSILKVIIGDRNDNAMKNGSSNIFVYNYKGETGNVEIGRVYVDDPDDWDLPDKRFSWGSKGAHPLFELNPTNGMITMLHGANNNDYILEFEVVEESVNIPRHKVYALVNVTVREIPQEAVDKSGSIRFIDMSAEQFVEIMKEEDDPSAIGKSKKDILLEELSDILNAKSQNIDIFTVLHSSIHSNDTLLDVRFSAHGSPYYPPEKLNALIIDNFERLEMKLNAKIMMVPIDECVMERQYCEDSCINFLNIDTRPYAVFTNLTSFVGVRAEVVPKCQCFIEDLPIVCLNNGTLLPNRTCKCRRGYEGPFCESLSVSFNGDGWAMYPTLPLCTDLKLSFEILPLRSYGLVLYMGPLAFNPLLPISDFLALELQDGYPVLMVDYGSGTSEVRHKQIQLNDGKMHKIEINFAINNVDMIVDSCRTSECFTAGSPVGNHLNVNGPLQLGGSITSFAEIGKSLNWTKTPTNINFAGCLRNLTISMNNNIKTYDLEPRYALNANSFCKTIVGTAGVHFGINSNFLVALLVCIALLLILLLTVVVHRRRQDPYHDKDLDDIRENIIKYEDEGGGEVDTSYDLNVFPKPDRLPTTNKQQLLDKAPPIDEEPDIPGFLAIKKNNCDKDPETSPFDDVRHYAYEGDGSTSGSLSSLASCTDDGDLKFNYLSNFGPRFRKLADMYGEDSSEIDSQEGGEESWC
ncbi:DE-cadherin [Chrysoperla carnea]|uniref:DE-cadherin n=1 Tax=Chrysoperla carnea TaxID=189513 RepID=UPI001D071D5D|nr:DE-cadherin [Chrysoperla carnea]